MEKLKVAVMFGGISAEHDVSVLTGLQVLEAIDPERFDAFPVYVGLDGFWWVGEALRRRKTYLPDAAAKRELMRVALPVGDAREGGRWVLREVGKPFWRKAKTVPVDVVLPALHGTWGEDGTLQGALAAVGIPTVGGGVGGMAVAMHKFWTLELAKAAGVPVLPSALVWRGQPVDAKAIGRTVGKFPLFVKPNFLGSSIGAQVAHDAQELEQAIATVFRLDVAAIVQPCVANLVEYNVAVRRDGKKRVTSAIERPLRKGETLDFKDKYLSGGGMDKLGNKLGTGSQGMASATRVLNPPELDEAKAEAIRGWAEAVFEALDMAGTPRMDFLSDEATGKVWFNEINPLPGSFAYFLWEGAETPLGFTDLLSGLVDEALLRAKTRGRVVDPVASGGAIFHKRG